jgi:hypothetical protein
VIARSSARPHRLLAVALSALAALGLVACTSSGDGGEGLTRDFLDTGAQYVSDPPPGGSSAEPWVDLVQSVDQRTLFCLDVVVHRVSDLYSVTFTLAFDPGQAGLRGYTVGDFLGDPSDLLVSVDGSATPGAVLVGVSRQLREHGMTGVTGSEGVLISLCFDVVGDGDSRPVDFVPNLALEDPAGAPVPNAPPTWVGGSLSTRSF